MHISLQSVDIAARSCRRNKRRGWATQQWDARYIDRLFATRELLQSQSWQPGLMRAFVAHNGAKPREILAPAYADRVIHHWLIPQLAAVIEPRFIHSSAANRVGKGTHFAVRCLQRSMRQVLAENAGASATSEQCATSTKATAYFLQLDIANFFYSIDRRILFFLLHRHLTKANYGADAPKLTLPQADFLLACIHKLLFSPLKIKELNPRALASLPANKRLIGAPIGKGLPIGNLSSQFFGNVYLNELDQYIKHGLPCRHYVRYVDDFVLVHKNPQQLLAWRSAIAEFLAKNLQLELKPKYALSRVHSGADFLGYIVRPHYLQVRRRVLGNLRARLRCYATQLIARRADGYQLRLEQDRISELNAVLASYLGHFQHAQYLRLWAQLEAEFPWLRLIFKHIHPTSVASSSNKPLATQSKAKAQADDQQEATRPQLVRLDKPAKASSFHQQWLFFAEHCCTDWLFIIKGACLVSAQLAWQRLFNSIEASQRQSLPQLRSRAIDRSLAETSARLWSQLEQHLYAQRQSFQLVSATGRLLPSGIAERALSLAHIPSTHHCYYE